MSKKVVDFGVVTVTILDITVGIHTAALQVLVTLLNILWTPSARVSIITITVTTTTTANYYYYYDNNNNNNNNDDNMPANQYPTVRIYA